MTDTGFKISAASARADYYALFGLEPHYTIDSSDLERRYLERSKSVHPDRFVNAPAHERVSALQESMLLNQAYKTLKQPLPRAEYLLERHGVTIGDNERLDPGFLMEVLELREQLAEAKHARDIPTLRLLQADMLARRDAALGQVAVLFSHIEAGDESEQARERALAEVKEQVILSRYIRRYLEEFDDLFDVFDVLDVLEDESKP